MHREKTHGTEIDVCSRHGAWLERGKLTWILQQAVASQELEWNREMIEAYDKGYHWPFGHFQKLVDLLLDTLGSSP